MNSYEWDYMKERHSDLLASIRARQDPIRELSRIERLCQDFFDVWTPEEARRIAGERYGTHQIDPHVRRLRDCIEGLTAYREVLQDWVVWRSRADTGRAAEE